MHVFSDLKFCIYPSLVTTIGETSYGLMKRLWKEDTEGSEKRVLIVSKETVFSFLLI